MYSCVADVREMQRLCSDIAERTASTNKKKDRINAVEKALGLSWNRCLEFLSGRARHVDSWEKDLARDHLAALKRAEQQREAAEHISYLNRCLGHLKASDPELLGPHVDIVERALIAGGILDRALVEAPSQHQA